MSLAEVNTRFIQQADPGLLKRWFADEELDLTLWQEEDGHLAHFQFVLHGREIVEWDRQRGIRIGTVQGPNEGGPHSHRTYVLKLQTDGETLSRAVEEFREQSSDVEPGLREFIVCALSGDQEKARTWTAPSQPAPVPADQLETCVRTIALKTPRSITTLLAEMAADGWELMALGSNHAVFGRTPGGDNPDTVYSVRSITLRLPYQIQSLMAEHGIAGQSLGGVGGSYAFFKRARNRPPRPREFMLDSVTLRGIHGIRELLDLRGSAGWALTGIGMNFAFFERPLDAGGPAPHWDHADTWCSMVAISARTERRLEAVVAERCQDGWRPCGLNSTYVFFRRLRG